MTRKAIKPRVLLDRYENKNFHWMIRLDVKPKQLRFGETEPQYKCKHILRHGTRKPVFKVIGCWAVQT